VRTTREKVNKFLERLKNGEDCLEDFIDYSRGYIQYIAYKYLIDKSQVDDAVFSAYDRILQAIQSFDSSNNGLAWIVKIAQNEAYKLNRKEPGNNVALEDYKNMLADNKPYDDDCLNRYDLERAIERLDEKERLMIEYRIFMDLTMREIAEQMDIPLSTAAYILKQALKKLKKYLK